MSAAVKNITGTRDVNNTSKIFTKDVKRNSELVTNNVKDIQKMLTWKETEGTLATAAKIAPEVSVSVIKETSEKAAVDVKTLPGDEALKLANEISISMDGIGDDAPKLAVGVSDDGKSHSEDKAHCLKSDLVATSDKVSDLSPDSVLDNIHVLGEGIQESGMEDDRCGKGMLADGESTTDHRKSMENEAKTELLGDENELPKADVRDPDNHDLTSKEEVIPDLKIVADAGHLKQQLAEMSDNDVGPCKRTPRRRQVEKAEEEGESYSSNDSVTAHSNSNTCVSGVVKGEVKTENSILYAENNGTSLPMKKSKEEKGTSANDMKCATPVIKDKVLGPLKQTRGSCVENVNEGGESSQESEKKVVKRSLESKVESVEVKKLRVGGSDGKKMLHSEEGKSVVKTTPQVNTEGSTTVFNEEGKKLKQNIQDLKEGVSTNEDVTREFKKIKEGGTEGEKGTSDEDFAEEMKKACKFIVREKMVENKGIVGVEKSDKSVEEKSKGIKEETDQKKAPLGAFIRGLRQNITSLSQSGLEELMLRKMCEGIAKQCDTDDADRRIMMFENMQKMWMRKAQQIEKQIKDLGLVTRKFKSDLEVHRVGTVPTKISRSVGLQIEAGLSKHVPVRSTDVILRASSSRAEEKESLPKDPLPAPCPKPTPGKLSMTSPSSTPPSSVKAGAVKAIGANGPKPSSAVSQQQSYTVPVAAKPTVTSAASQSSGAASRNATFLAPPSANSSESEQDDSNVIDLTDEDDVRVCSDNVPRPVTTPENAPRRFNISSNAPRNVSSSPNAPQTVNTSTNAVSFHTRSPAKSTSPASSPGREGSVSLSSTTTANVLVGGRPVRVVQSAGTTASTGTVQSIAGSRLTYVLPTSGIPGQQVSQVQQSRQGPVLSSTSPVRTASVTTSPSRPAAVPAYGLKSGASVPASQVGDKPSGVLRTSALSVPVKAAGPNQNRLGPSTSKLAAPSAPGSGSVTARLVPHSHPAPLPPAPIIATNPNWKSPPPRPELKVTKTNNRNQPGIVLSWNLNLTNEHAEIASYQLYAYQEGKAVPNVLLWKKIGDVKALPLPMACTLTQFIDGDKYHFAVRAVDVHTRCGPFSEPGDIVLSRE